MRRSFSAVFLAGTLLASCQTPGTSPPPESLPLQSQTAVTPNPDLVSFGHRVAVRHCAQCHALDPGAASPLADAPPFPTLYARFPVERLAQEIEGGMMVGHPRMPLLRRLDEDEASALVAYLSQFRRDEAAPAPHQ
jgi:mono/diheme cytochrome c family protein